MREDGFAWWKQRFEQMGRYFDAFRMDTSWLLPHLEHSVACRWKRLFGRFMPVLAVMRDEFVARGIAFDHERYVKPFFITEEIFVTSSVRTPPRQSTVSSRQNPMVVTR